MRKDGTEQGNAGPLEEIRDIEKALKPLGYEVTAFKEISDGFKVKIEVIRPDYMESLKQ
jgi:hypothetical protein